MGGGRRFGGGNAAIVAGTFVDWFATATSLAASMLGGFGICGVCGGAVCAGGRRVCRATGCDSHPGVRVLFLAILNHLHRQEFTQILALTPVFLAIGISVYACWQFAAKSDRVWNLHSQYVGRGSGTFIYPNSLSAYLEILTPVAVCYALIGRVSHVTKILAGYAAVVMLAGILATFSRGGLLVTGAMLVVLCVALLAQRDYRWHGLAMALALGVAAVVAVPKEQSIQATLRTGQAEGQVAPDDIRYALWHSAIGIWQDHFWLGAGPAQFDRLFWKYRTAKVQVDPDRAHSDYLNTLSDYGVVGAALVLLAWWLLFWGAVRTWKAVRGTPNDFARRSSNKMALLIGGCVGLIAIFLHSAIDFTLQVPAVAILTIALMALVSSLTRFATERYWVSVGAGLRVGLTLIIGAGFVGLVYGGWRSAREDYWVRQAAQAPADSRQQELALRRALAIEPQNPDTTHSLGDCLLARSELNESTEPDALAREALNWYQRAAKLDPHNPDNWTGMGACLDCINAGDAGSQLEAAHDFDRADQLDPNGYFTATLIGRHYVQAGDYAAARSWFDRSMHLEWKDNGWTAQYETNVDRWLAAAAERQKPENSK